MKIINQYHIHQIINPLKRTRILLFLLVTILLTTCEKRSFDNIWDENANSYPQYFWSIDSLNITSIGLTENKLSWTYSGDKRIEGIKIDRKLGEGDWAEAYVVLTKDARSWIDDSVSPDPSINYSYRVYAFAGKLNSVPQIVTRKGSVITAPTALLITQNTIRKVILTWQDNSIGEQGFRIERKHEGQQDWEILATTSSNVASYIDENFILNKQVYYRISAFINQYTSAYLENSFNAVFPAPSAFSFHKNTINKITLTWLDNSIGELGFRIERKQEGQQDWELIGTNSENVSSFIDESFILNTQVYYRVSAFYDQYTSAYAENIYNAIIPSPTTLAITVLTNNRVKLSWQYNSVGVQGFRIERKYEDQQDWELIGTNSEYVTNFIDESFILNTFVYYRVSAYYDQYTSAYVENNFNSRPCGSTFTVTDIEGNVYNTIRIGNQCWMAENLKYLPSVSPPQTGSNTSPFYYVYGYNGSNVAAAKATANYQTYGVLYNFQAALSACPPGWHLPLDSELEDLTDRLGGVSVAGGKMKTTGTTYWQSPNTGATNSSGFGSLPGGVRSTQDHFWGIKQISYYWSVAVSTSDSVCTSTILYDAAMIYRYTIANDNMNSGLGVRCIRD